MTRAARIASLLFVVACGGVGRDARGQNAADTVASAWLARIPSHPEIASWLRLRAAASTPDSAARAALYRDVDLRVARERIPWVEAAAREHFGDVHGALAAYRALGATTATLRLRDTLATTEEERAAVRADLVAFISNAPPDSVREGYALFDRLFTDATPAEQLAIARAASRAGAWSRARTGFQRVEQGASSDGSPPSLTMQDRFSYATALARTGDPRRAVAVYATVTDPEPLASAARYQGARALLAAGDAAGARAALRAAAASSDTSAAASLALLADLTSDDGDDSTSRTLLLELARRFPSSRFAAQARFDAAIIAFIQGDNAAAAREFQSLASARFDTAAAIYWTGRARLARGDRAAAQEAWRSVIRTDSTSYYAALAAARLGVANLPRAAAAEPYPRVPSVDSAVSRVASLQSLGMAPEAQLENDALYHDAPSDRARLLATAAAFAGTDQASRAISLGRRALRSYGPSVGVYDLIYPLVARDTIVEQSRALGIDPALVAGIIRQESSWNPRAVSIVGARGLMQLMPDVARSIAPAVGISNWSPALLFEPGLNVELGVRHLAPLLHSQPNVQRALAAYNAGESRVVRWAKKAGADDPDVFTERISFAETRDYVKVVLRNRELYRALYGI